MTGDPDPDRVSNSDRVSVRELRPWLWLPVAALVFVLVTRVLYADSPELQARDLLDGIALGSAVVTGLLVLPLHATRLRRWHAAGLFGVLTATAYGVCVAGIILVGLVTAGGDLSTLPETAGVGLLVMSVAFVVTFWISLPLGAGFGLLAWAYAHRRRTGRADG